MIALELERGVRVGLLVAGFLAPVAVGVVLRVAGHSPAVQQTLGGADEPVVCDAARFDADCPAGTWCVADRCVAVRIAERAGPEESCVGLECTPGNECHRSSCVPVEKLPVAPPACREPAVKRALEALSRSCVQASGDQEATLLNCRTEVWSRISQSDARFEELVMTMPGAFSVFFPNGLPDGRGTWPNAAARRGYAEAIAAHAEALRAARLILVIGRASVSGGEDENRELAERRAKLVEGILVELLGPGHRQIFHWGLAADFTLSMHAMRQRMRAPPIAADAAAVEALASLQRPEFDLASLSEAEFTRVSHMLNRVTFVVPIPCDGHEFNPLPALRGRWTETETRP